MRGQRVGGGEAQRPRGKRWRREKGRELGAWGRQDPRRPGKGKEARFFRLTAAGGGAAGGERRRLRPCVEGQRTAARPAPLPAPGGVPPRSSALRVRAARVRSAGLHRLLLRLLLRAAASRACAGLAWAPGPRPARATRGGPRGPWGPRSWALASTEPPPHAAPGPGAPRPPRELSTGQGGVPASDERAPTPAAASCLPGRKGGSGITVARPG